MCDSGSFLKVVCFAKAEGVYSKEIAIQWKTLWPFQQNSCDAVAQRLISTEMIVAVVQQSGNKRVCRVVIQDLLPGGTSKVDVSETFTRRVLTGVTSIDHQVNVYVSHVT